MNGLADDFVKVQLQKVNISLEDAEELFDILDPDRGGTVLLDEFISGCLKSRGAARGKEVLEISCQVGWCMEKLIKMQNEIRTMSTLVHRLAGVSQETKTPS